jgi:tRNA nucleotidyltransferase/poly(A) polymerase
MFTINNKTVNIIDTITLNGFKVYIVGGAVRDYLTGTVPHDIDLATNATPNELVQIFPSAKLVGESFGVTIIDNIEVATFRTDIHNGIGDRNCTVKFADTINEDLSRRDFTINAMAYDYLDGTLIDLYGGREDLQNGIIRFVGNPTDRINEDPNRMLRACRFAARIDGIIDNDSLEAIKNNSYLMLSHVAPERISIEIMKAMHISNASTFFNYMLLTGILEMVLPSLHECHIHSDHGSHHIEDIYAHCMLVGDSISCKYPIVKLAGYLHDIGKPKSHVDGTFHDHERYSEIIILTELKNLKFTNSDIDTISKLARVHMYSVYEDISPKALRKIVKKLVDNDIDYKDFLRLKLADRKGNIGKLPNTISDIKIRYRKLFSNDIIDTPFNVTSLNIDGHILMKELNMSPSKQIGIILNSLLEYVIDNGNTFNERDILLRKARDFFIDTHSK